MVHYRRRHHRRRPAICVCTAAWCFTVPPSRWLQGTCLAVQNGHRVALSLSPAQVHALQHARPVHGIHATSPSLQRAQVQWQA